MTGLTLDAVSIGYDKDLISDITMQVSPGKIVALIGPNGSGKSTLLKTVTGQLAPRGGVIFLDGKDKRAMAVKEIASSMSMVTTSAPHPELMTCREVIESGRYPYTGLFGKLSEEDIKSVDEAIAVTETQDVADKFFTKISDGQRQRVMLARSICQLPQVLVLDEPTSFLDIRFRIDILTKIRKLAKEKNIAILMSIHEPEVAMKLADTVVAVGENKVMRIGSPSEVFKEDFIRRLYCLGNADVNLLAAPPWIADKKGQASADEVQMAAGEDAAFAKRVIMITGTMSNVGKSIIAAGLCRIFTQDGYRVAPFKSQNMANNSYVTADGLEMGRAQVTQALCCNASPDVRMNPILLKPVSDCGSQVVVMGKPVGNMNAKEYFGYRTELIPVIKEAYESLRSEYDIIVCEGAGSPAEINLNENDIVNMGLAKMINAPVLLVGDIDRGGVFAQLIGTLDLLDEDDRKRVAGLVINKFRGDEALFESGRKMLEERSDCAVLGVVPYIDLNIDDEDSLTGRFEKREKKTFDIAVIKLAHISNFTDFDALEQFEDVSVRYVDSPRDIDGADIVIIPGTKNTIDDLAKLCEDHMDEAILKAAEAGKVIIGICGGYQMLGRSIRDPEGYEGGGSVAGLGLLPVDTVICSGKVRTLTKATFTDATGVLASLKGYEAEGYEIHMGKTEPAYDACEFTSGKTGYCRDNIYGTYIHGLFDSGAVAAKIIDCVAKAAGKNIDTSSAADMEDIRNDRYDRLADTLRASLDIDSIYKIMGIDDDKR